MVEINQKTEIGRTMNLQTHLHGDDDPAMKVTITTTETCRVDGDRYKAEECDNQMWRRRDGSGQGQGLLLLLLVAAAGCCW